MSRAWLSSGAVAVLGMGVALPGEPLTTDALIDRVAERFPVPRRRAIAAARRLGVASRHVARPFAARIERAAPGHANPDLAAEALRRALAAADLRAADLGYLIGHTATPAQPIPSNIALVADRLTYDGPAVELRQACTGFANALMIAFGLLARRGAAPVGIVGSETASLFFDPAAIEADGDLVSFVQMGDGAAAVVLGPAKAGSARIEAAWFGTAGHGRAPGLQMRCGGADHPAARDSGPITAEHDHLAVAEHGPALFDAGVAAAARHGISLGQAHRIVPHQASGRVGAALAQRYGIAREKIFVHADRVGNTGSAAIWLALAELRGAMERGDTALALGAEATKHMHGGFLYTHA